MEESEQSDTFTFIFVNQNVTLKMLTNVGGGGLFELNILGMI